MSSSEISSKATIAKNTMLLYGRTVLIMLVSLYTSRVILQALGVEDYGVYTTIGGIVSILSVVIGPIDTSISRFLTYELGRGDKVMLRRYFSSGLTIIVLFSLTAVLILEVAGIWFLNNKMVLDESRLTAANWVLHLTILSFVINMLASPYRAALIAHERMSLFAYLGILDAVLKLGISFMIRYSTSDKLILYAILMLIEAIIVRFIYTVVCNKEFEECKKTKLGIDKDVFGGLFSFAGWNFFGATALVCRGQGINILFNLFGGPIVNAAYGIANQINAAIGSFVNNFTTAINPSIIKSYAAKENSYMMSLVFQGAKYSFFLVLLFSLPLLLETQYITKLWLGQIPEYSVPFIQLLLLHSLIESFSKTIMIGVNASGNVKKYQLIVGGFQILSLPFAYLLLSLGFIPSIVLLAILLIDVMALFTRMFLARSIFSLSFRGFAKSVLAVSLLATVVAIPIPLVSKMMIDEGVFRLLLVSTISVVSTAFSILFVGCTRSEREAIMNKIKLFLNHVYHK